MIQPLTTTEFEQYVKCCTRNSSPSTHRDAFTSTLDAALALTEPDSEGIFRYEHSQLAVKFWQATLWLGVYRHFNLSIDDFIATYFPSRPASVHRNRLHIKRIVEVWGPDFWHQLGRRGVHLEAVPSKNFIETLHKAAARNVPLADFAGGLSSWLPKYYARPLAIIKCKSWVDQLAEGTYILQRKALVDYLDAVFKKEVVEKANEAASDDEWTSSESGSEGTPQEDTTVLPSVERPRGREEQSLSGDNGDDGDDDSALALDFDASPSRIGAETPASPETLPNETDLITIDDSLELPSRSSSAAEVPFETNITMRPAPNRGRRTRCHSEASSPLHGQSQLRTSNESAKLMDRIPRTAFGRIVKSTPSQHPVDHAVLRRRINDTAWLQVLDSIKKAYSENDVVAQEADTARSSFQSAEEAESRLRRDIGQELKWDGPATVKDLDEARGRKDANAKALIDVQTLVGQFRAQIQNVSSQNESLLRDRVSIQADDEGIDREIADLRSESKMLHDHAEKIFDAEKLASTMSEKSNAATREAEKQEAGHEVLMQFMSWDTSTQREFLKSI